ncbi:MAG: leucine-rich repeat protein [Muribaculaceae bacterium]|nr:leucine-rich repeat protein [Muribaculaceae bacterium]
MRVSIRIAFVAVAMTLLPLMASAYDFKVGDIAYNFVAGTNNEVAVTFTSNVIQPDPTLNNYYGVSDANIPETVKYNGKTYSVTGIEAFTFQYSPITSIKIPKTIKRIGTYAFHSCSQLKTVHISDVAAWCNIEYDYVSSDIYALSCCPTYNSSDVVVYMNGQPLTDVVIPASVTEIKRFAFYNWEFLKSVTINKNLKSIGQAAFSYCNNLKNVYISDLTAWFNMEGHYYLLSHCPCNLYLNNQLLIDLVVPENFKNIPSNSFYNIKSLKSVTFHNGVDTIGNQAFYGCQALTSITIPYSVNRLGVQAFSRCIGLQTIYAERYKPASTTISFNNDDFANCVLYVPRQHIKEYKSAAEWKSFTNIVGWDPFPGDLNEDYVVNGTDVTALYNCLLNGEAVAGDADVNGDGIVNGTDVTALYNILLQ